MQPRDQVHDADFCPELVCLQEVSVAPRHIAVNAARSCFSVRVAIDNEPHVHNHSIDRQEISIRFVKGCPVDDFRCIENDDIGRLALAQNTSVDETERGRHHTGHFVYGLGQGQKA